MVCASALCVAMAAEASSVGVRCPSQKAPPRVISDLVGLHVVTAASGFGMWRIVQTGV